MKLKVSKTKVKLDRWHKNSKSDN